MLTETADFHQVSKSDIVEEYLLLTNGHDRPLRYHDVYQSVVCQNTLNFATNAKAVRINHIHSGTSRRNWRTRDTRAA
jgi:hypothetical protein